MSLPSNKLRLALLALLALSALALYTFFTQKAKESHPPPSKKEKTVLPSHSETRIPSKETKNISSKNVPNPIKTLPPITPMTYPDPSNDFPSNPRFASYGSESQTASDDLDTLGQCLQAFWTFLKNPDALSVRSNLSITQSLTGKNPEGIPFLPADSPHINAHGELTDRWGTPIHFHPESLIHIDIRSAGPDRDLYTEDDIIHSSKRSGSRI